MSAEEQERQIAYMIESDADGYRDKQGFFLELIERLPWAKRPDLAELTRYYKLNYMTHARVMNHGVQTLEQCKALGLRLGVITNGKSGLQHGKIDRLGLRPFFDAIVVSDDIGMKKPDPRIYMTALERLGTVAEETIIVGDHPRNDIWGAAELGIRGVWLRRAHTWDVEGRPWHEIHELNELISLIQEQINP
jgi:putative hydrolase of the HAD superfamily